jgi:hypothetical protein
MASSAASLSSTAVSISSVASLSSTAVSLSSVAASLSSTAGASVSAADESTSAPLTALSVSVAGSGSSGSLGSCSTVTPTSRRDLPPSSSPRPKTDFSFCNSDIDRYLPVVPLKAVRLQDE